MICLTGKKEARCRTSLLMLCHGSTAMKNHKGTETTVYPFSKWAFYITPVLNLKRGCRARSQNKHQCASITSKSQSRALLKVTAISRLQSPDRPAPYPYLTNISETRGILERQTRGTWPLKWQTAAPSASVASHRGGFTLVVREWCWCRACLIQTER